ncbi:ankyrin repeat domain-containing protein [Haloferula sp. BvORR071]|uniref:ankyrin repeat domain-containing protein n=1 Tax=Haloferula sp. BvORR071 TaxID=1396141 RepID=UPI0006989EA1|nr:ankyrin repeat domain-containing protein [Haloferula sp. BvORR071]
MSFELVLWLIPNLFIALVVLLIAFIVVKLVNVSRPQRRRIHLGKRGWWGVLLFLFLAILVMTAISRPPEWREATERELTDACDGDHMLRARFWLLMGANPDGESDLTPPLCVAAYHHSHRVLRLLLEKGANPNKMAEPEGTPLSDAVNSRNPEAIKLLLAAGADPRYSSTWTAADQAKRLHYDELIPLIRPYLSEPEAPPQR